MSWSKFAPWVLLLVGAVLLAACGSGSLEGGTDGPGSDDVAEAAGSVPASVQGVDPAVLNAVAPYDPASAADALIVEESLSLLLEEPVRECLRERGFTSTPPPAEPMDREDAMRGFNAQFPYVEALIREGLQVHPPIETVGNDIDGPEVGAWVPPPGYDEARARCAAALPRHPADALWEAAASGWQEVLAGVEATEEVRSLAGEFSACLRAEGVPAESAQDEYQFLVYVDRLNAAAGHEPMKVAEIAQQYGRMYGQCGRDLFEARERLRGGERRAEYLERHAGAIRKLSRLLDGDTGTASP